MKDVIKPYKIYIFQQEQGKIIQMKTKNKLCYVAGNMASVACHCSILPRYPSFDLCCKPIIISDDDITAEIKVTGKGPSPD